MVKTERMVKGYARMWPRGIFERLDLDDGKKAKAVLARGLQFLERPGVYILYRDDEPYYIGKSNRLLQRLLLWARKPESRYYHFWNFFSAFAIEDRDRRNELESVLIACLPTAQNSANPKLQREPMPAEVRRLLRSLYSRGA